ncbi:MAG TPA: maleylpyruvate isomerase N-terminal domain-containing protein, partial [Micromonosporaceae bacterium]|nr:maleylpyruvate isomerase N-terminal domain-containing protein [Micromonosporaceae bacterium]
MATRLGLSEHVDGLRRGGVALREAAAKAGPDAPVPTCPAWDVTKLVTHQGMVHRWAAANLRGDNDHDTSASVAEAKQTA